LQSRRKKSTTLSESKAPSIGKDSNDPGSLSLGERKTKERKERLAKAAAEKALGSFKEMLEDSLVNATDFKCSYCKI